MEITTNYTDKDLLQFLGEQESQDIRWGSEYEDDLMDFLDNGHILTGAKLPWSNHQDSFRLRGGEVTIIAGMNGHKKSMLLGQIMAWLALQGERVGVMSFEMPIRDTQARMLRQAAGTQHPHKEYARDWVRWNYESICYYDKLDTAASDRVLGAIYYMAQEMGCKHIMIDSLTKCGLPYADREAEKKFIDALSATAKVFDIHIYLVCHVRKPAQGGEEYIPSKFDVRGAGELTDLVHNVLICWTDKRKEQLNKMVEFKGAGSISAKDHEYIQERPDQRLIVAKQRNGEFEGTIGLHFNKSSLQFTDREGRNLPFDIPRGEK